MQFRPRISKERRAECRGWHCLGHKSLVHCIIIIIIIIIMMMIIMIMIIIIIIIITNSTANPLPPSQHRHHAPPNELLNCAFPFVRRSRQQAVL